MSTPYIYYKIDILLICFLISSFQSTLAQSRPITLHHVICHVTMVTCLFVINKKKRKRKSKENQKKRNIKLRKINKRKRKILVFKCTIILRCYQDILLFLSKRENLLSTSLVQERCSFYLTEIIFIVNKVKVTFDIKSQYKDSQVMVP